MKGGIRDFLHSCKTADFGKVELSKRENAFYRRFNNEILYLCRALPESVQADAIRFVMWYFGANLGNKMDFFANYYSPSWSILYWLSRHWSHPNKRLMKGDVTSAITAQSMAMLLHSLDDHLTDRQVPVSPLTLRLRRGAWTIMKRAFHNLAEGIPSGEKTVRRFIDEYCSSVQGSKGLTSLDRYCDLFRKQMAIGMIAPVLLSMKMKGISDFSRDIEIAYGSFGIAWRLLDDIRDISRDMEKGVRSGIYLCLPKKVKTHWNNHNSKSHATAKDSLITVLNYIQEYQLIEKTKERICIELETAASIVEAYDLTGLAREFRYLARPLTKNGGT